MRRLPARAKATATAAALIALTACTGSHQRPAPAPKLDGFHVEYDVTDDRGIHSVEVTDVARPYRARMVRSVNGHSTGGIVWSERAIFDLRPDGSIQEASPVWPSFSGPDSHLDVALPVAVSQRLVRNVGTATVLGLPCTLWLSAQPLDGAPFSLPTAANRTTSCVAADGVILREQWQRGGATLRSRVATKRGPPAALTDHELFASTPTPRPTELSAYSITASTQAELTRLIPVPDPAAPAGLHSDRAVAVLDVDHSGGTPRITREGAVLTWTGGGHLVVAKYGRYLTQSAPRSTPTPSGGEPVALGRLGAGRLTPAFTGLQVEVLGPKGLLLTVTSDLPEAQLLAWMRALSF